MPKVVLKGAASKGKGLDTRRQRSDAAQAREMAAAVAAIEAATAAETDMRPTGGGVLAPPVVPVSTRPELDVTVAGRTASHVPGAARAGPEVPGAVMTGTDVPVSTNNVILSQLQASVLGLIETMKLLVSAMAATSSASRGRSEDTFLR